MFTLRIFFVDLVAFVRQDKHLWALLPDARTVTSSDDKLEEHHPVVLFLNGEGESGDWKKSELKLKQKLDLVGKKDSHAWLLDGEDIIIPYQDAYPRGVKLDASGVVSGFPDADNARKFAWVPRMSDIDADVALDLACVGPAPPPASVVGRLLLEQGDVESVQFVKTRMLKNNPLLVRLLTFEGYSDGTVAPLSPRSLTDVVLASVKISGSSLDIVTKRHSNGSEGHRASFRDVPENGKVDMLVGNLSASKERPFTRWGHHFKLYYKLSVQPGKGLIPYQGLPDSGKDPGTIEGQDSDLLSQIEDPEDIISIMSSIVQRPADFLLLAWRAVRLLLIGANHRPICSLVDFSPAGIEEVGRDEV